MAEKRFCSKCKHSMEYEGRSTEYCFAEDNQRTVGENWWEIFLEQILKPSTRNKNNDCSLYEKGNPH